MLSRARQEVPEFPKKVIKIAQAFLTPAPTLAQRIVRAKAKIRDAHIPFLVALLPEPEALGILALMLLHDSRRAARASAPGELILLDEQDRSLWNREQIEEGIRLVERALPSRDAGPYAIQAAIAAVHAEAPSADATDWGEIVGLYDVLARMDSSPVIELNRAVAVAMRDGPAAGLALIDAILGRGDLADYRLAHAARADLCRRLGGRAAS